MKYIKLTDSTRTEKASDVLVSDSFTRGLHLRSPILFQLEALRRAQIVVQVEVMNQSVQGTLGTIEDRRMLFHPLNHDVDQQLSDVATARVTYRYDNTKCEFMTSVIEALEPEGWLLAQPTMLQRLNDRGGHRQLFSTVDFILFYLAGEDLVQTCHVIDVSPKGFALLVNNEEMGLIVGQQIDGHLETGDEINQPLQATVRNIQPDPLILGVSRVGCRLSPTSDLNQEALQALVARHRHML